MNEMYTFSITYERGTGGKVTTENNVMFGISDEHVISFSRENGEKVEVNRRFIVLCEQKTELSFN